MLCGAVAIVLTHEPTCDNVLCLGLALLSRSVAYVINCLRLCALLRLHNFSNGIVSLFALPAAATTAAIGNQIADARDEFVTTPWMSLVIARMFTPIHFPGKSAAFCAIRV